ncbi:MAG: NUDIX domain-containing protein [Bacilli bacterium]|nr:NUDIX domain-containing protein [Bacilli bacterium]
MSNKKNVSHIGVYGILIDNNRILLIKKEGGPYDGMLDLPGGTIEFGEVPEKTLKREMLEETGLLVEDYKLFDANSVVFEYSHHEQPICIHHLGIFYTILNYENNIQTDLKIDEKNNDSKGCQFYHIESLQKHQLSKIALLELEKLGYHIKD